MPFDAIIIGAGPAGAIAALLLARAGKHAHLIEQHRFPRDKVCGECISALGIEVLTRLGLHRDLESAGATRLVRTILHASNGSIAVLQLRQPMCGLSRKRLDLVLLNAARSAGVALDQPVRCEGIIPGTPAELSARNLTTNQCRKLHAKWVLLADGKGALLPQRPRQTRNFGLKAHFANVAGPRDAIELFCANGHYGGLAPIENNLSNIAFSINAALLERFRGDLDGLFHLLLNQNPSLLNHFTRATRITDWLVSPLPRSPIADQWPIGIIPLGNAAAAIEPIGGEGMGLAMRSAELTAEYIVAQWDPYESSELRRKFHELWRPRRIGCRAAAQIFSSPLLAGPICNVLARSERARMWTMNAIGKN